MKHLQVRSNIMTMITSLVIITCVCEMIIVLHYWYIYTRIGVNYTKIITFSQLQIQLQCGSTNYNNYNYNHWYLTIFNYKYNYKEM